MAKKQYQAITIQVFRCEVEDIVTTSRIEQGVQWDSNQWTNDLKGDFE